MFHFSPFIKKIFFGAIKYISATINNGVIQFLAVTKVEWSKLIKTNFKELLKNKRNLVLYYNKLKTQNYVFFLYNIYIDWFAGITFSCSLSQINLCCTEMF